MVDCVIEAVNKTDVKGPVSAVEDARNCFERRAEKAADQDNEDAAFLAKSSRNALARVVGPAPGPAPSPMTAGQSYMVDARVLQDLALPPECRCETTGIVNGVSTGAAGCGRHGGEKEANTEMYCYVTGDMECGGAMPSVKFEGLYWVGCERVDFSEIFSPQCELHTAALVKVLTVPQPMPLAVPPKTWQRPPAFQLQPMAGSTPLEDFKAHMETWNLPMPAQWHAERFNIFAPSSAPGAAPSPVPSLPTFNGYGAAHAAAAVAAAGVIWQAHAPAPATDASWSSRPRELQAALKDIAPFASPAAAPATAPAAVPAAAPAAAPAVALLEKNRGQARGTQYAASANAQPMPKHRNLRKSPSRQTLHT